MLEQYILLLYYKEVELTVESLARTSTLSCKFGNVGVVPAQYIARHILKCISPPSSKAVQVAVEVSSNGVDYTTDLVQFHYQRKAIVTAIGPKTQALLWQPCSQVTDLAD